MHRSLVLLLTAFISLTSFTPAGYLSTDNDESAHYFQDEKRKKHKGRGHEHEGKIYPFSALGIPKGHLPPPGECKIWIPGLPAGQQGPPESCSSAFQNAPLGAWVITHTGDRYKVNIFSREKPTVVIEVRIYALL